VRKDNPKHIRDWDDLVRDEVSVITPNPKTSGGARWNYLAAYGYALKKYNNDPQATEDFMKKLYKNVPILDTGARGAATTFTQRQLGDVLMAWESEAYLILKELGEEHFEIVIPSMSIQAELPVAWIDTAVDQHNTRAVAEAYLRWLYHPEAQHLAAQHFLRPTEPQILQQYRQQFPEIPVLTIADFGGWEVAQAKHFSDGGVFDRIYNPMQSAVE
jgi:sulfate/thiosulfate-binding protein